MLNQSIDTSAYVPFRS